MARRTPTRTTTPGRSPAPRRAPPAGRPLRSAYQYNSAGQRTQMAATVDGTADFVDDYTYNAAGRGRVGPAAWGCRRRRRGRRDGRFRLQRRRASPHHSDRYEGGQLAVEGDYSYDSLGRLAGLVYRQGDTVLNSYAWTYSASGSPLLSGATTSVVPEGEGASPWYASGGLMPATDTSGVLDGAHFGRFCRPGPHDAPARRTTARPITVTTRPAS